jgi:hypothetical protein
VTRLSVYFPGQVFTVSGASEGTLAKAAEVPADLCEDGPVMTNKQIIVDWTQRLLTAAEGSIYYLTLTS